MKKKLLSLVLVAAMAATMLGGCGGNSGNGSANAGSQAGQGASSKTYKVGICQLIQHEALDAATKGFKDALTEKLGDQVSFDEQNASGDSATCATIANQFVSANVDLIMANATAQIGRAHV